ncbi:MAG: cyclic nucleotide-binding/CBS domain-containing protein [Halodesulfurarchaeum sp.]
MAVRDIMTSDVVTVQMGETVQEAVEEMLNSRAGSVIVLTGDELSGIITERDVLVAGAGIERPFADIPVSRVMSRNLVTIHPDTPLADAIEKMHDYSIKKLPVIEDDALVGIVTMTDLIYHQHDLVDEAKQLEQKREMTEE